MRDHLLTKYGRRYLLIAITAAAILLTMAYSFAMSSRMLGKYVPLVSAALRIEQEATTAHLWFEEILSGDRHENIETVITHIDRSVWYANAMLSGGEEPNVTYLPLEDAELDPILASLIDKLHSYRQLTFERYATLETSGPGTEVDQQYDRIFKTFNSEADLLVSGLQAKIAAEKRLYQELQTILMVIVLLLSGLILLIHVQFDRRHEADLADISREVEVRRAAEAELKEMNTLKDGFISIASHELRTPLTIISGYSEMLLENADLEREQRRECLSSIHDKAQSLNRIVDEFLDVSRLESGHPISIVKTPIRLGVVAAAVAKQAQDTHDQHFIQVTFDEQPPLLADLDRIQQVIENLVSNAIKYSPDGGGIWLTGTQQGNRYQVTVADEGIGMNAAQLKQVFRKYYRANSADNAVKGLGIGLFLAKSIIELHGGEIWAESAPGKGTRFHFNLPLDTQPS